MKNGQHTLHFHVHACLVCGLDCHDWLLDIPVVDSQVLNELVGSLLEDIHEVLLDSLEVLVGTRGARKDTPVTLEGTPVELEDTHVGLEDSPLERDRMENILQVQEDMKMEDSQQVVVDRNANGSHALFLSPSHRHLFPYPHLPSPYKPALLSGHQKMYCKGRNRVDLQHCPDKVDNPLYLEHVLRKVVGKHLIEVEMHLILGVNMLSPGKLDIPGYLEGMRLRVVDMCHSSEGYTHLC